MISALLMVSVTAGTVLVMTRVTVVPPWENVNLFSPDAETQEPEIPCSERSRTADHSGKRLTIRCAIDIVFFKARGYVEEGLDTLSLIRPDVWSRFANAFYGGGELR